MDRNFRLEAERSAYASKRRCFVSRAVCTGSSSEEVGQAVVAMLQMPGLYAADIDLSAGMVA